MIAKMERENEHLHTFGITLENFQKINLILNHYDFEPNDFREFTTIHSNIVFD